MTNWKNITKYNELWKSGVVSNPLVVLVGGYAGTGKTTVAENIRDVVGFVNILPTGVVRSVVQGFVNEEMNPYLFSHTFDLHKGSNSKSNNEMIVQRYRSQAEPVAEAINRTISFVSTEKQHFIFDGNHILPGLMRGVDGVICVEFYLKVSSIQAHKKMLGGPTHSRNLNEKQFQTGRVIQDYIVQEAIKYNKPLFEYKNATKLALEHIDRKLGDYLLKFDGVIMDNANKKRKEQNQPSAILLRKYP